MRYQSFEASIQDEIHGIPSGRRIVEAVIGRKWVSVRQPGRSGHRIGKSVWLSLDPQPVTRKRRKGRL